MILIPLFHQLSQNFQYLNLILADFMKKSNLEIIIFI